MGLRRKELILKIFNIAWLVIALQCQAVNTESTLELGEWLCKPF
jgi:hypothetical protein